ncbi:MAG TPA: hypothetical protein VGN61_14835 [Verrucomicrobiae bacterium]
MGIIALVSLLALLGHWRRAEAVRPQVATVSAKTEGVEFITKKQLFALFPNRPIAIIGGPGHKQFVLLDELANNNSGSSHHFGVSN